MRNTAQQRIASTVRQQLQVQPRLAPVRGEMTISVGCDSSAIWARAEAAGEPSLEASIEESLWWLPLRTGRATVLSQQLSQSLLERFHAARSSEHA